MLARADVVRSVDLVLGIFLGTGRPVNGPHSSAIVIAVEGVF